MFLLNFIFIVITFILMFMILNNKKRTFSEIGNSVIYDRPMIADHLFIVLVMLGFIIAIFVRVYKFGDIPGSFNQDGAMAALDAKALGLYGTDRFGMKYPTHLTAWVYGQMSAMMSYLQIPTIKLFGLTALGVRLPSLIVSLCGILCLFLFIHKAFGKNLALAVLYFAAINPWHIMQSRWALEANLYPHFCMIGIYFLHMALQTHRRKLNFVISMTFFGLSMYCYGIALYTMPVFLLLTVILLCKYRKIKISEIVLCVISYLAVAWPFITTMLINFLGLETIETPWFTIPYFEHSVRSNDILFFAKEPLKQLVINFTNMVNIILFQGDDHLYNSIPGYGNMYLFTVPFIILGIVSMTKRMRYNNASLITVSMFITSVFCGIVTASVNTNRINIVFYSLMIFAVIGIYEVFHYFSTKSYVKTMIPVFYLVAFFSFCGFYFTEYPKMVDELFYVDFKNASEYMSNQDSEIYYISEDSKDEKYYVSLAEVLTMFYHDIDALYFQGKTTDDFGKTYDERYVYFTCGELSEIEPGFYLVTSNDLSKFEDVDHTIETFGHFYVVNVP